MKERVWAHGRGERRELRVNVVNSVMLSVAEEKINVSNGPPMGPGPPLLDHPFHCWSVWKLLFVGARNVRNGSYTGERDT